MIYALTKPIILNIATNSEMSEMFWNPLQMDKTVSFDKKARSIIYVIKAEMR